MLGLSALLGCGLWRIFSKRAFAGCNYLGKMMLNRIKLFSYSVVSSIKK
jgi:hypothetical protein